jgi:hypothetical protein
MRVADGDRIDIEGLSLGVIYTHYLARGKRRPLHAIKSLYRNVPASDTTAAEKPAAVPAEAAPKVAPDEAPASETAKVTPAVSPQEGPVATPAPVTATPKATQLPAASIAQCAYRVPRCVLRRPEARKLNCSTRTARASPAQSCRCVT